MIAALGPKGGSRDVRREISILMVVGTAQLYRSSVQTPAGRRVSPGIAVSRQERDLNPSGHWALRRDGRGGAES